MNNNCCFNCNTTQHLNDYWPDDQPQEILLCDDCCEAQAKIEAEADRLSALPSCDYRAVVMDKAETIQQLVNGLRAHDMSGCKSCVSLSLPEVA